MQKTQSRLTLALLFTALVVLVFFGTQFITSPIDFLYRDTANLSTVRSVARIAALLATTVLIIAGLVLAVPTALQPGRWYKKLLYAVPIFFLLFLLGGVVSALIGVGAVGTLFNIEGVGPVSFPAAWLALAGVGSTLAVVIAAARTHLPASTVTTAVRTTGLASVLAVIATLAMLASVAIVSASQPSSFGPAGGGFPGGGRPPGAQGPASTPEVLPPGATPEVGAPASTPEVGGAAPASTPEVNGAQPASTPEVSQPGATPEVGAPASTPEVGGGGFPGGGQPPQGGFPPGGPGGPGGGSANVTGRYAIGGGLMAIFAIISLGSVVGALSTTRQPVSGGQQVTQVNFSRETTSAVLAVIGLAVILGGVSQLITVPHDNPPVTTPINWDSEQTSQLVHNTCMDCHSNETVWPWYSYIAPSSWLTSMHVHNGRAQMNLSELDKMPSFQRASLAENMANQIRSGNMPPKDYLILHPAANLTDEQKEELIRGLEASLSNP